MERRREEEADACLRKAPLDHGRRRGDPNAERLVDSAPPVRLDADRLPCFATWTPHAAITRAAQDEMLNVPERSPPVPPRVEQIVVAFRNVDGLRAHRAGQADDFLRPLALHRKANQQGGDVRRRGTPSMTSVIAAEASSAVKSSCRVSFSISA